MLILAEADFNLAQLVVELSQGGQDFFHSPISQCEKIKILTRFQDSFLQPISGSRRYSIDILKIPLIEDILLASIHVPDKSHNTPDDQAEFCRNFIEEVKRVEENIKITKTVIVGDSNMNPFEPTMVKSTGFHAISSANVVEKLSRTIQERECKFLYNPMWGWLGDLKNDIIGSYHYNTGNHINYFWNTFDQVLIRPELIPNLDKESLQILSSDEKKSLLTRHGLPDKKAFSDHLPLLFTLKMNIMI